MERAAFPCRAGKLYTTLLNIPPSFYSMPGSEILPQPEKHNHLSNAVAKEQLVKYNIVLIIEGKENISLREETTVCSIPWLPLQPVT
jgi:hypothetical protein